MSTSDGQQNGHTSAATAEARAAEMFRATFEQAAVGMAHVATTGQLLRVNDRLCRMLGYARADLLQLALADVTAPEDVATDQQQMQLLLAGQIGHYALEKRYRRHDGSQLWVAVTVSLARAADGTPDYVIKVIEDIGDRKAVEAGLAKITQLYRTLSETRQAILRSETREDLFACICAIAVAHGGLRLAWVGLLAPTGCDVEIVAKVGRGDTVDATRYLDAVAISACADRPEGQGPTGRAIREGAPQVVNDFLALADTRPWQERAAAFGLQSSAAFALRAGGRIVGALNVYADQPGFFDGEVVGLLEKMAADVGHALDRQGFVASLARQEEEYRSLFEQAPDGVLVANGAGLVMTANARAQALFGMSGSSLAGTDITQLVVPDERARMPAAIALLADGQTHAGEWHLQRADGGGFLADVVAGRMADGRLQFFVRDISAQRRLELIDRGSALVLEALSRDEDLPSILTQLVRHIEMLVPDAIGSIVLLDSTGERVAGSIAPGLPEAYNQAFIGAPIGPAAGSCGTAVYRKQGVVVEDIETSPLWADYRSLARLGNVRACWSEPVFAGERVLGTFALYYREPRGPKPADVTALERAAHLAALAIRRSELQGALRAALHRQRQLFEDAPVGLALCRMDGSLIEVNPAYARMIGRGVDETLKLSYWDITPQEYAEQEQAQLRELAATGRYGPYEKAYRHADGHHVPVRLQGRLLTVDGEAVIWSAVEDITDRKRHEEHLRVAHERLQALSARVLSAQETERSHLSRELHDQVGQALTAMKIILQSAAARATDDWLAAQIAKGVAIADTTLTQVRSLSLDLRPPQLDDLGLVAALRWFLERQAALAGFVGVVEDRGTPRKLPDAVAIAAYRIAQEAVTNTIRHAGAHAVRIGVGCTAAGLRLEVRDDGAGFDPDRQLTPGSLGLLSMMERAMLVGGRVDIDSGNGQGTTIIAVLPLPEDAEMTP